MTVLDWFRKPSEVAYNSKYEPTTTLTDSGYSKEFPVSYYYYGFLLNSSSLYTIQVIILKNDGYEIGPLTMEPITKLSMKGIDIKQIVVLQPNAINSGVTSGATFRYDFIGTTQPPLPGNESIDIAPYVKNTTVKQFILNNSGTPVTSFPFTVYTVPKGYKLKIHSCFVLLNTSATVGTRSVQLLQIVYDGVDLYAPTGILADTADQTTVSSGFIGSGSMSSYLKSRTYSGVTYNFISWGSEAILGEGDIIYIDGILQSGDSVPIYGIDAELIQI